MTRHSGILRNAQAALKSARALCDTVRKHIDEAEAAVSACVDAGGEDDMEHAFMPSAHATEHRRRHRSGRPAKLDADPELRAFVLARVNHMTYPELQAAVAAAFPEGRRVCRTAINNCWRRRQPS